VLNFSTSLFVVLFAHLFLGEKWNCVSVGGAFLTVVGVILILRPPFLTGASALDFHTLVRHFPPFLAINYSFPMTKGQFCGCSFDWLF
jgi:drug/metabolite transporter (DMT)-like permease